MGKEVRVSGVLEFGRRGRGERRMIVVEESKPCSDCGMSKPLSAFRGRRPWCIECGLVRGREYVARGELQRRSLEALCERVKELEGRVGELEGVLRRLDLL